MTEYSIRIASADLIFSAAHFITFESGGCEPLHGHDYRVQAELFGPLCASEYVVDFVVVQDFLRSILKELGHRVLLPGKHPSIAIVEESGEYVVRYAGRRWVLPVDNCRVLPIGNTTTEMFAQYICRRLNDDLISAKQFPVSRIVIEVSECDGFAAVCRMVLNCKETENEQNK